MRFTRPTFFLGTLFTLVLSGCALAPLTEQLTARGLEAGRLEVSSQFSGYQDKASNLLLVPSVRALYGATSNWTLGLKTELKTFTFETRYSIINSLDQEGFSLAPLGAIVLIGNQFSYYVGLVASYLWNGFEPYVAYRYNIVTFDATQVDSSMFNNIPPFRFDFSSFYLGLKYWITPEVATGAEWIFLADGVGAPWAVKNAASLQLSFIL